MTLTSQVQQLQSLLSDTVTRVPVFESTGAIRYVIHQSMIYKFIADNRGLRITEAGAERDATLADFVARPDLRAMVTKLAAIARNSTLADAKAAMASIDGSGRIRDRDWAAYRSGSRMDHQ